MTLSLPIVAPCDVRSAADVVACAPYRARVPVATCVARRALRGPTVPLECGGCSVGAEVSARVGGER